jgi:hypothetical protein
VPNTACALYFKPEKPVLPCNYSAIGCRATPVPVASNPGSCKIYGRDLRTLKHLHSLDTETPCAVVFWYAVVLARLSNPISRNLFSPKSQHLVGGQRIPYPKVHLNLIPFLCLLQFLNLKDKSNFPVHLPWNQNHSLLSGKSAI